MPVEVKKTMLGYRETTENEYPTHMLLTNLEHDNLLNQVSRLENEVRNHKREIEDLREEKGKAVERAVDWVKHENELKMVKVRETVEQYKLKSERLESLNKNLIRITKERANAERNLRPKKKRSGYLLISTEEYIYMRREYKKTTALPCWRTKFQTPYGVDITCSSVEELIYTDIMKNGIGKSLGLKRVYGNEHFDGLSVQEFYELWNQEINFSFRRTHRLNATKKFWEMDLLTKWIVDIPEDLIDGTPEKGDKKKES